MVARNRAELERIGLFFDHHFCHQASPLPVRGGGFVGNWIPWRGLESRPPPRGEAAHGRRMNQLYSAVPACLWGSNPPPPFFENCSVGGFYGHLTMQAPTFSK